MQLTNEFTQKNLVEGANFVSQDRFEFVAKTMLFDRCLLDGRNRSDTDKQLET